MNHNLSSKHFDVLIIGAGGAGLMSAISAIDNGTKNIAVISKVFPTNSHTASAKGGINASLGNVCEDDWKWHAFDTLKGSDYLADCDAVEVMCKRAEEAILFLEKNGTVFSRDAFGKIAQRAYGGQTTNYGKGEVAYRACYSKDKTGHTILQTLNQQALSRDVKFFNEFFVIDLLIENKVCYGCLAIDLNNGELVVFSGKITILATGGYSQIYQNTTSSLICTGDGSALVFKAGLPLQDMEFVQFHPTGIFGCGFLITEAVRSEGAYLLNKNHYRFMQDYAPKMLELASRDVISQAMATEIYNGNGVDDKFIYLDMRHIKPEVLYKKLPGVVELVKNFTHLDVAKDLIPVAPSAHYSMGGVPCDVDCNVIDGLMSVGEVACVSVHGANRLGCNSLLDLIVFGKIAGEKAAEKISNNLTKNSNKIALKIAEEKILEFNKIFSDQKNEFSLDEIKKSLKINNEATLGVLREEKLMEKGLSKNIDLYKKFRNYRVKKRTLIWNEELISYLELENLLLNSLAVSFSALNRKESRGAHFRFDFRERDDNNFLFHSLVFMNSLNEIKMEFKLKPVNNISQIPDLQLIPQIRKY